MKFALGVLTDGRADYLQRTIASARANLDGDITEWWMFDDSGDLAHQTWLCRAYASFMHIQNGQRLGFGGAIQSAWRVLESQSLADYIFWLEADFTFNQPIPLERLAVVLHNNPNLAQIALRRQPWNEQEKAAGGVVEQHPDDYHDCRDTFGNEWLEHRRYFTTNPNLFRRDLCELGWPDVPNSEGQFTHKLLGYGYRFALWGARHQPPAVHHIGDQRAGCGY